MCVSGLLCEREDLSKPLLGAVVVFFASGVVGVMAERLCGFGDEAIECFQAVVCCNFCSPPPLPVFDFRHLVHAFYAVGEQHPRGGQYLEELCGWEVLQLFDGLLELSGCLV